MDIRKESIEDESKGYLSTKINKLIGFFNLIFGNLNEEEKLFIYFRNNRGYFDTLVLLISIIGALKVKAPMIHIG